MPDIVQNLGDFFSAEKTDLLILAKNGLGYILGDFFAKLIWSPCCRPKLLSMPDSNCGRSRWLSATIFHFIFFVCFLLLNCQHQENKEPVGFSLQNPSVSSLPAASGFWTSVR
jgi:hypothetical protein